MATPRTVTVWSKSIAGARGDGRNEDGVWSALSGVAHACIDGMGGLRRVTPEGEVGGEHVTAVLLDSFASQMTDLPRDLGVAEAKSILKGVVAAGGKRVWDELNLSGNAPAAGHDAEPVLLGAAATIAVFCQRFTKLVIAQNGDTRAYKWSADGLDQLTEDQNVPTMLHRMGHITEEQLARVRMVLNTFDGETDEELDGPVREIWRQRHILFGELGDSDPAAEPELVPCDTEPGDVFVLCSDGIHDNLTQDGIAGVLERAVRDEEDPAAALVYAAAEVALARRARSVPDDISALATRVD